MILETVTSSNTTTPTAGLPANVDAASFSMSWAAVVTGTVAFTIEDTLDGTTWFASPDTASSQTASIRGHYAFPVKAIRINQASGTGSIVLTLLQSAE